MEGSDDGQRSSYTLLVRHAIVAHDGQ